MGQAFGFAEKGEGPFELPKRREGVADIETKINRLLLARAALRRRLEEMQRLLKGFGGLPRPPSLFGNVYSQPDGVGVIPNGAVLQAERRTSRVPPRTPTAKSTYRPAPVACTMGF